MILQIQKKVRKMQKALRYSTKARIGLSQIAAYIANCFSEKRLNQFIDELEQTLISICKKPDLYPNEKIAIGKVIRKCVFNR